jgi:hypothetical protein
MKEPVMDTDRNFAAWMIAGGLRPVDPAEARDLGHRRALAATRRDTPSVVNRLAAAAIAAFRPAPAPVAPACCPA